MLGAPAAAAALLAALGLLQRRMVLDRAPELSPWCETDGCGAGPAEGCGVAVVTTTLGAAAAHCGPLAGGQLAGPAVEARCCSAIPAACEANPPTAGTQKPASGPPLPLIPSRFPGGACMGACGPQSAATDELVALQRAQQLGAALHKHQVPCQVPCTLIAALPALPGRLPEVQTNWRRWRLLAVSGTCMELLAPSSGQRGHLQYQCSKCPNYFVLLPLEPGYNAK